MDPFAKFDGVAQHGQWSITGLEPTPGDEWRRMLAFLNITHGEWQAMLATVEALFRRGHELVVGTYDALLHHPETAAVLGWEQGVDPEHLAERRRFFTVWLARLLGLDRSADLAEYLFNAGRLHAGHGPRQTHVPPVYVTGSISLVNATFARFISEEMPNHPSGPTALAGWNKLLAAHLHLMQCGYQAARALDDGEIPVQVAVFGKLRELMGRRAQSSRLDVRLAGNVCLEHALRKLFNYFPSARSEVFDVVWQGGERMDHTGTPWFEPTREFCIKPMWRVLVNGKDASFLEGAQTRLQAGDEIHLFPPGR